jgi:hypothetical protein
MESFGQKLRRERESREKPLEEIAGSTKIRLRFLEALETNEFDELPGPAFGKFFIRAYAEALDMDPEPLIAEYDREQKRRAEAGTADTAETPHVDVQSRIRDRLRRWAGSGTPHEKILEDPVEIEPEIAAEIPAREEQPVEVRSEQPADPAPEQEPEPEPEPYSSEAIEPGPAPAPDPSVVGEPLESPVVYPGEASEDDEARPGPLGLRPRTLVVGAITLALVAVLVIAFFPVGDSEGETADALTAMPAIDGASESVTDPEAAPGDEGEAEEAPPPRQVAPEPVEPVAVEEQRPAPTPVPGAGSLSVSEFGIGRDVVNRRLQGTGDRFEEGTTISFWTRVVGGRRGQSIRHVWLHDGGPVQSVTLEIGGPHWRTHSRKTLWGTGPWTVEARDADGEVLARATFTCIPAGP